MRIAQITISTPYKENLRGTSGIQYHLMVMRPKHVEVVTYTFNANKLTPEQIAEVERELNIKIKLISIPRWLAWFMAHPLFIIRSFLKYPFTAYYKLPREIVEEIQSSGYDGLWLYGQELFRILNDFPMMKRVHTLPDCESLYYYRMLGQRFVFENPQIMFRQMAMYPKFLRMEHDFPKDTSIQYTLVGEADVAFLKNNNPELQARFLRHPHYEIANPEKVIGFARPMIKIILAGQYNIYMQQAADELIEKMTQVSNLQSHYKITILGKGWEKSVERLKKAGYDVTHITFAPDYIEEICKHDIQITPICIGTGTKGKVLDALANGLLVIGTNYALENIAVENGVSCIEYKDASEVVRVFSDIAVHPHKYEQIAEEGRKSILVNHGRERISKEFFEMFEN